MCLMMCLHVFNDVCMCLMMYVCVHAFNEVLVCY